MFPYQFPLTKSALLPGNGARIALMNHKYMGSIVAFSISKSVEPNEEHKEMTSGFQQGNVCKC